MKSHDSFVTEAFYHLRKVYRVALRYTTLRSYLNWMLVSWSLHHIILAGLFGSICRKFSEVVRKISHT